MTSIPGCAPVVPQLPGSKSQKRCVWQVSLDLFDVVFGMGCVHWLLWGLGCWVRTCQVSETGWVSGADLSAPLHCPCWESRNRHIPGTRHQPRDLLFNVSVKQNYVKPQRVKFCSSLPSCKVTKLVLAESRVCGTRKQDGRHKQGEQAVESDSRAACAIGSLAPVCPAVLKLAL